MDSADAGADAWVRIAEPQLTELRIEHLVSAVDSSIALPRALAGERAEAVTGYSEWEGRWRGAGVTLGFDWALLRGRMLLINAAEIRTNIQLVARNGSPRPPAASRGRLALWIDSLPWRAVAARELGRSRS